MNADKNQLFTKLVRRVFGPEINRQVRALLSSAENDNTFMVGARNASQSYRDRLDADRYQVLSDCLEAWRANPLARRLIELTTQYVIGSGIVFTCKHEGTQAFLEKFWQNHLNRMAVRSAEMCDELSRTGNLFVVLSTDAAGMSYIRTIPATDIDSIKAKPNDIEQPIYITSKMDLNGDVTTWEAYDEDLDTRDDTGHFAPKMLHYTINRPVGAQWGESDLAPLLRWLTRYANWLEDRARLNRFRTAFLYVVKAKFTSEVERLNRQNKLAANPPTPGSILVVDESEDWSCINPQLNSADANEDGLSLKKMIASGSGVPLHFLAEPESATRTTAEAAGGPTYRRFEQRQLFFLWMIGDLLRAVISRRAMVDARVSRRADVKLQGCDISGRDNVSLSMGAQNVLNTFSQLRDRGLITDAELVRMTYFFAGEMVDENDVLDEAKAAGIKPVPPYPGSIQLPPVTQNGALSPNNSTPGGQSPDTVQPAGSIGADKNTPSGAGKKPGNQSRPQGAVDLDTGEVIP